MYADRHTSGQQVKLGSRTPVSVEDPYTRSRKMADLRVQEEEQETARLGARKFNSTSKKARYVSRSPIASRYAPANQRTVIEEEPRYSRTEVYNNRPSTKYRNNVQTSAFTIEEDQDVEIEYKHKYQPGLTLIRSSPGTNTVIEEKEVYDNGEELITHTHYENGVRINTMIPEDGEITFSPNRTASKKKDYSYSSHSRSRQIEDEDSIRYERTSPFRASPIKIRASSPSGVYTRNRHLVKEDRDTAMRYSPIPNREGKSSYLRTHQPVEEVEIVTRTRESGLGSRSPTLFES